MQDTASRLCSEQAGKQSTQSNPIQISTFSTIHSTVLLPLRELMSRDDPITSAHVSHANDDHVHDAAIPRMHDAISTDHEAQPLLEEGSLAAKPQAGPRSVDLKQRYAAYTAFLVLGVRVADAISDSALTGLLFHHRLQCFCRGEDRDAHPGRVC